MFNLWGFGPFNLKTMYAIKAYSNKGDISIKNPIRFSPDSAIKSGYKLLGRNNVVRVEIMHQQGKYPAILFKELRKYV